MHVHHAHGDNFKVSTFSVVFSLPYTKNGYFTPLIIGIYAELDRRMYQSEIVIRKVTMKNATKRGGTTLTHLLVLSGNQRAEIANVTIMNNRHGALALFDSIYRPPVWS